MKERPVGMNRLASALSPYLLQHKDNPVHWHEWGSSAFDEARKRDCPVLLSVGYAACHWCHVMAHESFENAATAGLMNDLFVNIKVDREERPDIDQFYMWAVQAMGEQGGWPLTIFLTHEGTPFWGGTYFPPEPRFGRPSFGQVLAGVADLYANHRNRVTSNTAVLSQHLAERNVSVGVADTLPDDAHLNAVTSRLMGSIDTRNGGIGQAPKFPNAVMWEALWRLWLRTGDDAAHEACIDWLKSLCWGGIYDHLGGGIHRYTVDEAWFVPHFEKMLYDNALFVRSLTLAYRATGSDLFRTRIEHTVNCLLRDFRLEDGGFASSYDADSEGVEGLYYTWTASEIEDVLGSGPEANEFCKFYGVTPAGNWEGRNILAALSQSNGRLPSQDVTGRHLQDLREVLFASRSRRTAPSRDDKVLCDWNCLLIRALAEAGMALDRPDWIATAAHSFDVVSTRMMPAGRLVHARRGDRVSGSAMASDFAACINAAISLYAATGDDRYIKAALGHAHELERWHGDGAGGYHLAAADRNDLMLRQFSDLDESTPSASAMAIEALLRLSLAANDAATMERAEQAARSAWSRVHQTPFASFGVINAIDTLAAPQKLVMLGRSQSMSELVRASADPARLDLTVGDAERAQAVIGTVTDISPNEKAAAYLCRGPVCLPPIEDASELERLLRPASKG